MIKITDAKYGVQLEIDGFVVPELVSLNMRSRYDSLVEITADIYATHPFSVELKNESCLIEFTNERVAAAARDLLRAVRGYKALERSPEFRALQMLVEGSGSPTE